MNNILLQITYVKRKKLEHTSIKTETQCARREFVQPAPDFLAKHYYK